MGNKLVFRVLLPAMLFLNVYKISDPSGVKLDYVWYVLITVGVIFLLSIPLVLLVTPRAQRRGVILQVGFRSNYALIGLPLAQSLFGDEGVMVATVLSAFIIPAFNVLAVVSLSVFREGKHTVNVKKILLEIAKNPLILGVLAGGIALLLRALFVSWGVSFRLTDVAPVYTVLGYLSGMATPLSLLVLGAQFEFSAIKELRREILTGVLLRNLIVPVIGLGAAYLFFYPTHFTGAHFAAFIAMFATPVAVSSVPMAQEMDSDVSLAGQLVVWTTIASAFSVFIAALLLKMGGVFG
jgi:predicted permease